MANDVEPRKVDEARHDRGIGAKGAGDAQGMPVDQGRLPREGSEVAARSGGKPRFEAPADPVAIGREVGPQALEEAAAGYLTVLKNNTWHPDAAFNYEYIIRLRDQAAKGSQPPPPQKNEEESDNGESGAPTPATSQEGFQIYIPLEQGEKNPTGGEAGKSSAKERKG